DRDANRLAQILRSFGVGPDTLVGLCVERSAKMVVGLLGILKAGGAYVPLDPLYPRDRIQYILQDAQARVLVTQKSLRESFAAVPSDLVLIEILRSFGVGPDTLVGLCVERSAKMVVGLLGILKAGGAYVPLDPLYPRDRIQYILQDAQARVLVTQKSLRESFAAVPSDLVLI